MLVAWDACDGVYSSELSRVEVRRTLYRLRSEGRFDRSELDGALQELATMEAEIVFLPVTEAVLALASEPIPVVKTLDALHLATARQVRALAVPGLVFATHDRQMATAAAALGFPIEGYDFS